MKILTKEQRALLQKVDDFSDLAARQEFVPTDLGGGFVLRIKRLLRYRGRYLARVFIRLGIVPRKDVSIRTFWGRKLILPGGDMDTWMMRYGILGGAEHSLIKFFIKNIAADDIFYDIGAHAGFYTALAQQFIKSGQIHAFEPSVHMFRYLQQTASIAPRTILNNTAISNEVGEVVFFDSSIGHHSGKSTTIAAVSTLNRIRQRRTLVKATTLDEYCLTHPMPTIMKIDVEGGEKNVFAGAVKTLKTNSPIIAVELWSGDRFNYAKAAMRFLRNVGYSPFFLQKNGETTPVSFPELEKYLSIPRTESNFIFRKKQKEPAL